MGLYRLLTDLAAPVIALYLHRRKKKGREDVARFSERLGRPSKPRPSGKLIWCHAASVGESLSVLSLIREIEAAYPAWTVLLTTGTVTSANLMAKRLSEKTIHQFVPVDRWPYVTRFLNHWKPDLALWVESELWPNMLAAMKERQIPAVLLNGRMSEKSFRRWTMIPRSARKLLSPFVLGLAQTPDEASRYAALGLSDVRAIGNLKYAADPLPNDQDALDALCTAAQGRPLWLMASTHPGEEEIALSVHAHLKQKWPNVLTVIAPRHPARGEEIAQLVEHHGCTVARRSKNQPLLPGTDVYLADTMGEMGVLYRLARVCCLAGSFTWGGHNPIEPAQLGCAVVIGPQMYNFQVMADDILAAKAAIQVRDQAELATTIAHLLKAEGEVEILNKTAYDWAEAKRGVLTETMRLLAPFFTGKENHA